MDIVQQIKPKKYKLVSVTENFTSGGPRNMPLFVKATKRHFFGKKDPLIHKGSPPPVIGNGQDTPNPLSLPSTFTENFRLETNMPPCLTGTQPFTNTYAFSGTRIHDQQGPYSNGR
ncbi:hypothetical protein TNCV_2132791 [Trichonephila clavipes]|nr:hypothetical protein TNCV_2132791 [Trichonephila clavipes]